MSACKTAENRPAAAESFQYQRAVQWEGNAPSQSCVVLDAAVFEHAGSAAISDVRLYATNTRSTRETPYALTESAAEPGDVEPLAVEGQRVRGNAVEFDLHMPARPYSRIDLQTPLRDFVAIAEVSGGEVKGGPGKSLGTVTMFDFSGQRLPRSTALRLGESTLPWVHVQLRVFSAQGRPLDHLNAAVITGAQVPPSREGGVLYTPVIETKEIHADTAWTSAKLALPAHLPVDRIRLDLEPAFKADFVRTLKVQAAPHLLGSVGGVTEDIAGEIGRLNKSLPLIGLPPIHYSQLNLAVAFASNLRGDATVYARIQNGTLPPLPLRAVVLEMRQRSLCFDAAPGVSYTLRYGNPRLRAPGYAYAKSFALQAHPAALRLGPEERNPQLVDGGQVGVRERSPELFWVLLMAAVALIGAATMQWIRRNTKA